MKDVVQLPLDSKNITRFVVCTGCTKGHLCKFVHVREGAECVKEIPIHPNLEVGQLSDYPLPVIEHNGFYIVPTRWDTRKVGQVCRDFVCDGYCMKGGNCKCVHIISVRPGAAKPRMVRGTDKDSNMDVPPCGKVHHQDGSYTRKPYMNLIINEDK